MESIKKIFKKYDKFIKFVIVGVSNLCISLITYYILIFFSINYQIANVAGFITGSLNGYFWNKNWVFQNKSESKANIVKFYLVYLSTWGLSAILLYMWIELLGISGIIAPILNVFITTPINYILNKKWAFKN
ncbi:MAG: GtrA family protein [Fusobacteriales bacterium]|nr:GtrA family protein [Fusobacteriales bacterium]